MDKISIALWLKDFIADAHYQLQPLAASGSDRQNYVLHLGEAFYIVTHNAYVAENEAFFYWTQSLQEAHLPVTEILKISDDRKTYLQKHLGQQTLAEYMAEHGHTPQTHDYLNQSVEALLKLQKAFLNHQDYSQALEYQSYNRWAVYNDLFYFKNYFVDYLEIPYQKASLISEFEKIALGVEQLEGHSLMLRDCQSRNLMIDNNKIAFIDYQSAMRGPIFYDVVSLLYQAKANYPQAWKDQIIKKIMKTWSGKFHDDALEHNFKICQLLRFLQVLGAYGFRGLVQGKAHFISSIPQALANLQDLARNWEAMPQYPELQRLILSLDQQKITKKITK